MLWNLLINLHFEHCQHYNSWKQFVISPGFPTFTWTHYFCLSVKWVRYLRLELWTGFHYGSGWYYYLFIALVIHETSIIFYIEINFVNFRSHGGEDATSSTTLNTGLISYMCSPLYIILWYMHNLIIYCFGLFFPSTIPIHYVVNCARAQWLSTYMLQWCCNMTVG